MADEILVIPPIRQSLEDVESAKNNKLDAPLTEKSWYLYWQRTGDQVNKLGKLITYGTHADRPPAADMPVGSLYMETDRSNVIYQNIDGVWKYLTGTMWGTITPDQRPTDLGVNDGGFNFRGTDDAREFIWSQSTWIEVTAVRYGIHSGRPAPLTVADGSIYVESDRGGVIYQQQAGVWRYLAGTMYGTLVPDQRPTDLGVNDGGFDFRGTDQQREFIWSQSAWIEVTPTSPSAQYVQSTADVTLSTSMVDVPGASLTLPQAGRYLIIGSFLFKTTGDQGSALLGRVNQNGIDVTQPEVFYMVGAAAQEYTTCTMPWLYTASAAGQIVKLRALKSGGAGTSVVVTFGTTLTAVWLGP